MHPRRGSRIEARRAGIIAEDRVTRDLFLFIGSAAVKGFAFLGFNNVESCRDDRALIGAFDLARGRGRFETDEMDRKPVAVNAGFPSCFLSSSVAKLRQAKTQSASFG